MMRAHVGEIIRQSADKPLFSAGEKAKRQQQRDALEKELQEMQQRQQLAVRGFREDAKREQGAYSALVQAREEGVRAYTLSIDGCSSHGDSITDRS